MVNGQWSMVNGQWSMFNGQCFNVQCSMFNGQCSTILPFLIPYILVFFYIQLITCNRSSRRGSFDVGIRHRKWANRRKPHHKRLRIYIWLFHCRLLV